MDCETIMRLLTY